MTSIMPFALPILPLQHLKTFGIRMIAVDDQRVISVHPGGASYLRYYTLKIPYPGLLQDLPFKLGTYITFVNKGVTDI